MPTSVPTSVPTIGVDLGGTKILTALVSPAGVVLARDRRPTPANSLDASLEEIAAAVEAVLVEARITERDEVPGVGVGIAGLVAADRSTVLATPNLGWPPGDVGLALSERVGIRTVVENDANAAAWGEFIAGSARDVDDAVVVTLGTGIGGGLILDGRLRRGSAGVAGEIGHLEVVPEGRRCGCGRLGCWEMYASGSALVRAARQRASADPVAGAQLLARGDGTPDGLRGRMVTEAARAGDPVALGAFAETAHWLGVGLADLVAVLDPAAIVIGGGLSEAADLLLPEARVAMGRHVIGEDVRPPVRIVRATLGNDAGVIGAALLATLPS